MNSSPPHDGSYKSLFSHPEMVESLIRDFVPEDWVHEVDFTTLEKQNGSYVTDDLRERHDDVIWRVQCHGQWFYVYLLIEFQSTVDPWMAVRILTYVGLLYQDLLKSEALGSGDLLPPVFPLVLYNGPLAWKARQDIAELIVSPSSVLAAYRPSLRYFLVDEGRLGEEQLQGDGPATHLVRMERSELPESLRTAIRNFREKYSDPRYLSLRRALVVWIRRVLLNRVMPQEQIPELNELEEVETMLAERVTEWTQKWKMEGRKEGRMEGQASLLARQIAKRFGPQLVDAALWERLHSATPEQLDRWADRILDATSMDDVFTSN
jgi:hypothetical protein